MSATHPLQGLCSLSCEITYQIHNSHTMEERYVCMGRGEREMDGEGVKERREVNEEEVKERRERNKCA